MVAVPATYESLKNMSLYTKEHCPCYNSGINVKHAFNITWPQQPLWMYTADNELGASISNVTDVTRLKIQ
jgi:hypothetical protein